MNKGEFSIRWVCICGKVNAWSRTLSDKVTKVVYSTTCPTCKDGVTIALSRTKDSLISLGESFIMGESNADKT